MSFFWKQKCRFMLRISVGVRFDEDFFRWIIPIFWCQMSHSNVFYCSLLSLWAAFRWGLGITFIWSQKRFLLLEYICRIWCSDVLFSKLICCIFLLQESSFLIFRLLLFAESCCVFSVVLVRGGFCFPAGTRTRTAEMPPNTEKASHRYCSFKGLTYHPHPPSKDTNNCGFTENPEVPNVQILKKGTDPYAIMSVYQPEPQRAEPQLPVMMLSRSVVGMQKIPTRRSLTARFRMNKLVTVHMFLLLSTMKHTTPFPTMHTRKISR